MNEGWAGVIGAFLVTYLWMSVAMVLVGPPADMPSYERRELCRVVLMELKSSPRDTPETQREIALSNATRRAWCQRKS